MVKDLHMTYTQTPAFLKHCFTWLRLVLVVARGISRNSHLEYVRSSSLTRAPTRLTALGTWSLSHWTTKEVPEIMYFKWFSQITNIS